MVEAAASPEGHTLLEPKGVLWLPENAGRFGDWGLEPDVDVVSVSANVLYEGVVDPARFWIGQDLRDYLRGALEDPSGMSIEAALQTDVEEDPVGCVVFMEPLDEGPSTGGIEPTKGDSSSPMVSRFDAFEEQSEVYVGAVLMSAMRGVGSAMFTRYIQHYEIRGDLMCLEHLCGGGF